MNLVGQMRYMTKGMWTILHIHVHVPLMFMSCEARCDDTLDVIRVTILG